MAVEFCYMAEGSDERFENPMDAVMEAMDQSTKDGLEKKVVRGVKYTHGEWQYYTLQKVKVPEEAVKLGMSIADSSVSDQTYGGF